MICAIHQPNFFPWLGYFDKINQSDVFVFLDHVNYPKSSKTMSTWSNRSAILVNGKKHWIHCPVVRESGIQKIDEVKINESYDWRSKLIKTLEYNYKKSRHYQETSAFIYQLISYQAEKLADYNAYVIRQICEKLEIDTAFVRQSQLCTKDASTELLIEITKKTGCNRYMCGGGATGYQKDDRFEEEQIHLMYQNFVSPVYEQGIGECVKGLSMIDVLFHCGFEKTKYLVKRMGIDECH